MSPKRSLYLVCYDVADDKRLKAALKLARNYATGGQKSVHECWLTDAEKGDLIANYHAVLDMHQDRLLILRLDPQQTVHVLGHGVIPEERDWYYIG